MSVYVGSLPSTSPLTSNLTSPSFSHAHRLESSPLYGHFENGASQPHVISQLRQLLYYHLDCNLLWNALFLAGRLQAYEPRSSEAAYLLALCHLRLGQLKAAYDSSRNSGSRGTHLGCSYVFAQACLGLGRYVEGVTAIDRSRGLWSSRNSWGALNH